MRNRGVLPGTEKIKLLNRLPVESLCDLYSARKFLRTPIHQGGIMKKLPRIFRSRSSEGWFSGGELRSAERPAGPSARRVVRRAGPRRKSGGRREGRPGMSSEVRVRAPRGRSQVDMDTEPRLPTRARKS